MKKRQGDWRKKVFCLLLGLMMVFSQIGFAFAETSLDLSGEPQPSRTEEPQTGGETQDAEQPQTSEQPQEAEASAEEPQQPTPARTADELLNAANQLAEANLPQILADARMRMVYEGKQAMKMADAFAFTADAEAEDGDTRAWASYTPEGSEEAVSCDTLSYYTIEDPADWEALTACVNAGNTLAGKTVMLANDVDFSTLKDADGEQKALTPVGNVKVVGRIATYTPFSGIFDGQNHELKNILFDSEKATYDKVNIALFGCIQNAEIKDLTVSGKVNITAHEDKSSTYGGIAAIVGLLEGTSKLTHVTNDCEVSVTTSAHNAAGIVNTIGKTGTMRMENCANYGNVYSNTKYGSVAGLISSILSKNGQSKIINCFNEGVVTGGATNYEIAAASFDQWSEVKGCYGTGENALFRGSYSNMNYDKRSLITCAENSTEATAGYVTYVPQEQLHSWKTVWLLNQGSTTPAYTLKADQLQWAEADSPTVYRIALMPYTYNQETNPIKASLEVTEKKNLLGQDEQDYYVVGNTEFRAELNGTKEQYPVYTVNEVANGDRGAGQSRSETNEKKKEVLETTLKVQDKNITLQYGSMAEYELEPNTMWYSSQASEFILQTSGELRGFAQLVNAGNDFSGQTVKLGRDIDVRSGDWTPIASTKTTPFKGVFDGAGERITYSISTCSSSDQALFGYIVNAEIKNLTVAGKNEAGVNNSNRTAGLCASADNSKITDCTNEVEIPQGGQNTAGIVGASTNCVIENCVNGADITGSKNVAGIVANAGSGNTANACTSIRNCTNNGAIKGNGAAGIVAVYTAKATLRAPAIEKCRNSGAITANGANVGGIAGSFTGWMRDCENAAEIDGNGKSVIGGIVGLLSGTTSVENRIEKCCNSGAVYGTPIAGGIAGKTDSKKNSKIQIVNCENTGNVQTKKTGGATGASNGGIIGESTFPTSATQTGAALYVQSCISYVETNTTLKAVGKLFNKETAKPTRSYEAVYALAKEGENLAYDGTEPLAVNADSFKKGAMAIKLNKAVGENFWGYKEDAVHPLFDGFAKYPITEIVFKPFTSEDAAKYRIDLVSGRKSLILSNDGTEKSMEMPYDFDAKLCICDAKDDTKFAKAILVSGGKNSGLQDAKDIPIRAAGQNITVFYGDEAGYENFVFTDWYDDTAEELTIDTAGQLMGFAQLVNGGKDFNDKTVKLAKDIDLSKLCGEESVLNTISMMR